MMKEDSSVEKVKKYDYLNKYNQRSILEKNSSNQKSVHKSPKNREHFIKIQDKSRSRSPSKSYSLPKQTQNLEVIRKIHQPYNVAHSTAPDSPRQIFNNIPDFGNRLSAEITNQNQILRGQVTEYRKLVAKLQAQIEVYRKQIIVMKEKVCVEADFYEKKTIELARQLENYQKKYRILDEQLLERTMMQQNIERQVERSAEKMYEDYLKNLVHVLSLEKKTAIHPIIQYSHFQELEKTLDSKIRQIERENKVYFDFVKTLREMKIKIECGRSEGEIEDLRSLWKWLKKVGSVYYHIQGIRSIMAEKVEKHYRNKSRNVSREKIDSIKKYSIEELLNQMIFTYGS